MSHVGEEEVTDAFKPDGMLTYGGVTVPFRWPVIHTQEGKIMTTPAPELDPMVHHPPHYTNHPSGVEVIEVTREMTVSNLSNAWKYVSRHQHKGKPIQDLEKAVFYINDEEQRRKDWKYVHRGVQVVVIIDPGYVEAYAAFYKYVDAEPDEQLRNALVDIWNADKIDMQDENRTSVNELQRAKRFCLERIRQFRQFEAVAEEPPVTAPVSPIEFAKGGIIRPEATDTIARSVGHNREDYIGRLLDTEDGWIAISKIEVTRGGIVWITTADDSTYRFKPRAIVTTVDDELKELD